MCCVLIDIHVLLFPLLLFHSLRKSIFLLLFILFLFLILLVAPGPAAINQSPNDATTHLLFTLIRSISLSYFFLLSHIQLPLTLSRLSRLIVYLLSLSLLLHTRRSNFYMCVCVFALFFFLLFCVCLPLLII